MQKMESQYPSNLYRLFIFILIVLWVSIISIVFAAHHSSKLELAQSLVDSSRESLLLGDNRTAMIIYGKAIPKWFSSIQLKKENGTQVFDLPNTEQLNLTLTVPIWLIDGKTLYGYARFQYPFSHLLPSLFLWLTTASLLVSLLFYREKIRLTKERAVQSLIHRLNVENKIAHQVGHDIRSPLSAISILAVAPDLNKEEARQILKDASVRIQNIAQDLLDRSKRGLDNRINVEPVAVDSLIKNILNEKRIEYQNLGDVIFESSLTCNNLQVLSNKIELFRALSNLINNSLEAKGSRNLIIRIETSSDHDHAYIKIIDNGKGIPASILPKIGKGNFSYGKESSTSGSGIGIIHAKTTAHSCGGDLKISSTENVGTTITMSFQKFYA